MARQNEKVTEVKETTMRKYDILQRIVAVARDDSMGDLSPEHCEAFRDYLKTELEWRYPGADVFVTPLAEYGSTRAEFYGLEYNDDINFEVVDVVQTLWCNCPWEDILD